MYINKMVNGYFFSIQIIYFGLIYIHMCTKLKEIEDMSAQILPEIHRLKYS